MSKELSSEEYYNKLWLDNKELIQENIARLDKKRFAQELMLAEKDKEIKRLNNIINELEKRLIFDSEESNEDYVEEYLEGCVDEASIILDYLQELKGSDKE